MFARFRQKTTQPVRRQAREYGNVLRPFQQNKSGKNLMFTLNDERATNLSRLGISLNNALKKYGTGNGNIYNPIFVKRLKNASRNTKEKIKRERNNKLKSNRTLSLTEAAVLLYLMTSKNNGIHIPELRMTAKNVRNQNAIQTNSSGRYNRSPNNILANRIAIAKNLASR